MTDHQKFQNAVYLRQDDCVGCATCIRRCPTGAIRVRDGKARIKKEYCIDCGECIRVCPHHAKIADHDPLICMNQYKYTVALPAPALYAQFNNLTDTNIVLSGLIDMGFNDVFEVGAAAEIVSRMTRKYIREHPEGRPYISTACPAITRLIRIKYPNLIPNLIPILAPVEIAAHLARKKALKDTGLDSDDIGIFFISPCPAKVSACKSPLTSDVCQVDGVLSIRDVYPVLLSHMEKVADSPAQLAKAGRIGVGWGHSEGEAAALLTDDYLAADGIENVIRALDDFEDSSLQHLKFIELNACNGGCVGGTLTVENPYIARSRLKRIKRNLPNVPDPPIPTDFGYWTKSIEYEPVYKLGENFRENLAIMKQINEITSTLPGIDCGACGAPSCNLLAEDIVRGLAKETDCIYIYRNKYGDKEEQNEGQ